MKKLCLVAFAAPVLLATAGGSASAQYQPAVSPYINLNNRSAPPGIIYYGIIRPEIQLGRSVNLLQTQVQAQQQAAVGLQAPPGLLTTGHEVGFLNHGAYFQTVGGGPGTGTSAFTPRPAPAPARRGR